MVGCEVDGNREGYTVWPHSISTRSFFPEKLGKTIMSHIARALTFAFDENEEDEEIFVGYDEVMRKNSPAPLLIDPRKFSSLVKRVKSPEKEKREVALSAILSEVLSIIIESLPSGPVDRDTLIEFISKHKDLRVLVDPPKAVRKKTPVTRKSTPPKAKAVPRKKKCGQLTTKNTPCKIELVNGKCRVHG